MTDHQEATTKTCLLIYDGQCRMCVAAKQGLERLGSGNDPARVRMITYQSEEAKLALGDIYRQGRPDAAFLVYPNGNVSKGLDAFFPLLPGLKGGTLLRWFCKIPLVKFLAYGLYRLIAKHRYRLFGTVPIEHS